MCDGPNQTPCGHGTGRNVECPASIDCVAFGCANAADVVATADQHRRRTLTVVQPASFGIFYQPLVRHMTSERLVITLHSHDSRPTTSLVVYDLLPVRFPHAPCMCPWPMLAAHGHSCADLCFNAPSFPLLDGCGLSAPKDGASFCATWTPRLQGGQSASVNCWEGNTAGPHCRCYVGIGGRPGAWGTEIHRCDKDLDDESSYDDRFV